MDERQPEKSAEEEPPSDEIGAQVSRRNFLQRAAMLGLGATAIPAFLAACARVDDAASAVATATASPTFPPPTPFASPTAARVAAPTLVPVTPTPTVTPRPTAAPSSSPLPRPLSLDTEARKISHLLRRAGFGANPQELAFFRQMGLQKTVDYLVDYEQADDSALETMLTAQNLQVEERLNHLQRWWLLRMIYTKRPLLEKMVLFWHGLLTSEFHKVGKGAAMIEQNQLYRANAMGHFHELIKAVSRDPAMLTYLDSRTNHKAAPNENYARELMELFTMGVGHYTETDVRESARAFTGWGLRRGNFYFNANDHDSGQKTFLGQTGAWDGDDIVDIIMKQPAAAEHICRRLWEFYAYANPEPAVMNRLTRVFKANDTEIKPVVRAILASDEFYSTRAVLANVKCPAEAVTTALRSLGAQTNAAPLPNIMAGMGQQLFQPPNVAGWPGGAAWLNSSTLLERINFANLLTVSKRASFRFDAAQVLGARLLDNPAAAVDALADLLLGGMMPGETRALLTQFLAQLNQMETNLGASKPDVDGKARALIYLTLASPEFQLA